MPVAAINYALQLLALMPSLIGMGQSVMGLIQQGQNALGKMVAENREPTAEEWAALDSMRDNLHAKVQS